MGRPRRRGDEERAALEESPAELRRARQRESRRRSQSLLAGLLVPSLTLNLLFAAFVKLADKPVELPPKVYELDVIEPKPPGLPAARPKAPRPEVGRPEVGRQPRQPRQRKARDGRPTRPPVARRAPTQQPVAPVVRRDSRPPPASFAPRPRDLLRMRQPGQPAPRLALPQPRPESRDDDLRVDGQRFRRRRYADGGRLLSNVDGARAAAPDRASFWRTRAAPKNDVGRLSLAGLASLTGGRKGVLCNHLQRFPAAHAGRTIHLLIDSSPSMEGSMSSAEVCAVGVANSAVQKGYAVALGRFGASTICHPPTKRSALLRDHILARTRLDGTLLPTTCGADRARGPVDVVIVSDGGFFRADAAKLAEARRVLRKPVNRGMLYLVPDSRYMINPKVVAALRAIGFRVIHFGARTAVAPRRGSVF